jgi:hypothetical protein
MPPATKGKSIDAFPRTPTTAEPARLACARRIAAATTAAREVIFRWSAERVFMLVSFRFLTWRQPGAGSPEGLEGAPLLSRVFLREFRGNSRRGR